ARNQSEADKNFTTNQEALNKQAYEQMESLKGVSEPQARQQQWANIVRWAQSKSVGGAGQLPAVAPDNESLAKYEVPLGMHAQALEDAKVQAQGQEAQANTNKTNAELEFYKNNGGAPGVPAETIQMANYLRNVPGATPAGWPAYKAAQ